jgi:hypothetical protein
MKENYGKSTFKLHEKLNKLADEQINRYLEGSMSTEDQKLFYDDDFWCIVDPDLEGTVVGSKVRSVYLFKDVDNDDCLVKVEFRGAVSSIKDGEICVICNSINFYEH